MDNKRKDIDKYYTIEEKNESEIKIKGSKFIAQAAPVADKDEALMFLESVRAKHYNANHNCFAYRIGYDGLEFRASDDGEPSGSAGKPILFEIKKHNVSDIIVVVTRYFGGTKLGVGGLARAYSEAAGQTIEMCRRRPVHRTIPVRVFCTYEDISAVKRLVDEYAITFEEEYTDAVEFLANIPISKVDDFAGRITEDTGARAGTIIEKNNSD
ncbi:MAG: IMPACT family protein [Candidatus Kapaibacterium sp.]